VVPNPGPDRSQNVRGRKNADKPEPKIIENTADLHPAKVKDNPDFALTPFTRELNACKLIMRYDCVTG
jgi:hypothetical protein